MKFAFNDPIYNIAALVPIMAGRWKGDKLLSKPMVVHFIDAYMPYLVSMG